MQAVVTYKLTVREHGTIMFALDEYERVCKERAEVAAPHSAEKRNWQGRSLLAKELANRISG